MLDNLLEIEVAYNLLRDEAAEDKTKNPIDANYEKLNTNISVSVCACMTNCFYVNPGSHKCLFIADL